MSKRFSEHEKFVIERTYEAPPERVFAAMSDKSAKQAWFIGPDGWRQDDYVLEFRVGGREHAGGGPKGGPVHRYDAIYREIVTNERIVSTYEMHMDAVLTSVSVATIELHSEAGGQRTRLVYTEQVTFLDGHDKVAWREAGTRELFGKLDAYLQRTGAS